MVEGTEFEEFEALLGRREELRTDRSEVAAQLAAVEEAILRFMDRENRRSARVGRWEVAVNAPTAEQWDLPRLRLRLGELVEREMLSETAAAECLRRKVVEEPSRRDLTRIRRIDGVSEALADAVSLVPQRRQVTATKHAATS